jgi:cobalt-zinc-cadmium efflux system outer membrane protein
MLRKIVEICRAGGLGTGAAFLLCLGGCATIKPDKKINEALDLVQTHTGQRPDWLSPWDAGTPAWDEQSVLGIDEAVELALRNNRDLRADLELIGQTQADLVQAGLLQNPRFNLMVMFPDGGGRSMLRGGGFPIQALQELWLIPARKNVATLELRQAVLRVADRAVETAAEVKRVYAQIQYALRAIELIRANMSIVDQTRRLILTQQSSGKATLSEVSVAHIRYLRLESELIAMQAEYRSLKRQLLLLMGLATSTDAWTVQPVHELTEPIDPLQTEEELMATAEKNRLDLQAAGWATASAERQIELMRREGWPDVALGLSFERAPAPRAQGQSLAGKAGNAVATGLQGGMPEPIAPFAPTVRDSKWTVGPMLDFELPIFDWNQAQIAKAYHEYKQAWAEFESRRQSVASQVRETTVMYQQACEQVQFFRNAILPEVEKNLEVVKQSYLAGREEVTILLQVQEDVVMTRLNTLTFLRDVLVNRAELERQVGGRFESANPTGHAPTTDNERVESPTSQPNAED